MSLLPIMDLMFQEPSLLVMAGMVFSLFMGGASEAVKSVADYITEAVDENGVRNALVRFGILE